MKTHGMILSMVIAFSFDAVAMQKMKRVKETSSSSRIRMLNAGAFYVGERKVLLPLGVNSRVLLEHLLDASENNKSFNRDSQENNPPQTAAQK